MSDAEIEGDDAPQEMQCCWFSLSSERCNRTYEPDMLAVHVMFCDTHAHKALVSRGADPPIEPAYSWLENAEAGKYAAKT